MADNVFAGKNVATGFGKGMGAAAQKRIDRINETLGKWESDEEKYAKQLAETTLYRRRDLFKKQLEQYNQDLGAATGGADTTVTNVTQPGDGGQGYQPTTRAQNVARTASRVGPGGNVRAYGLAQGGRIGYQGGEFVDEDINIEGPGFDVNENLMASDPGAMDSLNEMSLQIFGKGVHELSEEEYGILIDMANEQASAGQDQGLASLV
jgi:hypothetical protein